MHKTAFYWECLGQSYPFDLSKKYLIYFKGCFCPPHRGHFDTVKQFTDMGPNIHVMIHHMGSERRHGVPYHLNREIWETYIEELLPRERVHLIRYSNIDDILDIPVIDSFNRLIYIRGNENYDINNTEISNQATFRSIINRLNQRGVQMDFYYMDRPQVKKLSASKFIKTLIRTKKRCRRENCNCKYNKLKFYMPSDLSEKIVMRLVLKIQKHYLYV